MQNSETKYQCTPFNSKEFLIDRLQDDEALARIVIDGCYDERYVIVPDDKPVEFIDLGGCLEETLHRLLDVKERDWPEGYESIDEVIFACLGATKSLIDDDEGIDIDLGYRMHSLLSVERVPFTARKYEERMYERYKLLWMLDQGITVFDAFAEWRDFLDPANGCDRGASTDDLFDQWESDEGFSGSLYSYFEEFLAEDYPMKDERWFDCDVDKAIWELDQPKKD